MNQPNWQKFTYTFVSYDLPPATQAAIFEWIRRNKYGGKDLLAALHCGSFIFATNSESIATHFRLTWIDKLTINNVNFIDSPHYTFPAETGCNWKLSEFER